MRVLVCFLLFCCVAPSFGQAYYDYGYDFTSSEDYDEDNYRRRYPFVKGYSPSFLGLVVGYNALSPKEVELGLSLNISSGLKKFGMTSGYQLLYRRALERKQNAIDLEMGVYGIVSIGMGVNYNFSTDGSAFGFKPFVGTSIYHFQLLYGYNFLRKKKQEWYQLPIHSLSIRYVIPLKASKDTDYYPRPAPNYRGLDGLNKNHPLNNQRNPGGYENDIRY